jgi:hypothetical protein
VTLAAAAAADRDPPRRGRHRYRLAAVFFLALVVYLLAAPAGAQPQQTGPPTPAIPQGCPGGPSGPAVPGTECPDGSVPTPIPAGCEGSPLSGPPVAGTTCPDGTVIPAPDGASSSTEAPRDTTADDRLAEMFALGAEEEHPLSAYDIGCDEGSWNAFLRKMWCGAQALPFALGKWFIGVGTQLMDWALDFRVADSLSPMAGLLSRVYNTSLIGPLQIRDLAWTVALFVGGWHLLRGRFADGAREVATTFIIAIIGAIVLANPQGYLEGSVALAQNTSGAVLESVDGALNNGPQAQDADAVRERLGMVLRRSFVAEPYDLIDWGESLTGECAAARNEILDDGPWGGDDRPREIMREHGCDPQAEFNARPSDNRAVSSLTVAGASGLVAILMVVLALGVFAAQITLVVLFSGASLAWAIALFPGGRSVLWWWISRLVWAVLITFTSIFLLSWIAITITVVLDNTTDISIVQRCLIAIMIVAVAFKFRHSVDKAIDGASSRLAGMMNKATGPTGAKPAAGAPAAGGGFRPLSWSPTQTAVTAAGAGLAGASTAARVTRTNAERARTVGGGAVKVGSSAVSGARAVALAPVRIPQAAKTKATQRALDVRATLDKARGTRAQWARNARHPLAAMRSAKSQGTEAASETMDWL